MKNKTRVIGILIVLFSTFHLAALTPPEPLTPPQRGVAYGNVLKPGWSAIYQWYKGAYGRTSYRRVIAEIRINLRSAVVVFSNGSQRDFYNIAIINNENTSAGTLRNWKIARNNRFDTILLRNGKLFHPIIRGYRNGTYYFKGRIAPLHRKHILMVYPNPSIPLRARL